MALSAVVAIVLGSAVLYQVQFKAELEHINNNLQELAKTAQQSAAISAYLSDKELAKEIITGLAGNDIVDGVLIISNERVLHSGGKITQNGSTLSQRYTLTFPFINGEVVGELIINPNNDFMQMRASDNATGFVFTMVIYTLLLIGILIPLLTWQLTLPLKKLALQIANVKPGTSNRLKSLQSHRNNEIGLLVEGTNRVLKLAQEALLEQHKLRQFVEKLQNQSRLVFDHSSTSIALIDFTGKTRTANTAFKKLFGEKYFQATAKHPPAKLAEFFADEDLFNQLMKKALLAKHPIGEDLQAKSDGDDESRWFHCVFAKVHDKSLGSFVELIMYDTSERLRGDQQGNRSALYDPLTKLLNRRAGIERMQSALENAYAKGTQCALLMIDLDKFKLINDVQGQEAGDQVLQEIARRMHTCVRGEDMIIRWGGDEFVIFIEGSRGKLDPVPIAKKIVKNLPTPIDLTNGKQVTVGASVGISRFPENSDDLVDLIEIADQKMYEVKNQGRNGYQIAS
ncbi:MAG: sensor domain-containing diguanylate cyclase [Gammaproteobacteria bacterium]|nr:sensor domain-containing diguanylate cyclase [Gammaproteobacteria bacterium]